MSKLRISYIDPSTINDPVVIVAEFERGARESKQAEDRWAKVNSKSARQAAQ